MAARDILAILNAFNVLPGDKKRMEAQQQMELDQIDRRSQAAIAQDKASSEEQLYAKRKTAQDEQERMLDSLYRRNMADGMSPQEATQAGNKMLSHIMTAQGLANSSTAELTYRHNKGAMPLALETGRLQEQAAAAGFDANRIANLAAGDISTVDRQQGPVTQMSKHQAMQRQNALLGAQSDAKMPYVDALAGAEGNKAINESLEATEKRGTIPNLIKTGTEESLATSKFNTAQANQGISTMLPPALVNQAATAKLGADIAESGFKTKAPGMSVVGKINPMALYDPNVLEVIKALSSSGGAPPPVTPQGISTNNSGGILRPRVNIRK